MSSTLQTITCFNCLFIPQHVNSTFTILFLKNQKNHKIHFKITPKQSDRITEKNRPNFGVAAQTVAKSIKTHIEGKKHQRQTAFLC